MAKYATYTSQAKTKVVSTNSPAAQAEESQAKLDQNMGNMFLTQSNKVMDKLATEKGQKDAEQQGMDWKPANSLFEAGKAYNQGGQTIARTLAGIQLSNSYQNMYQSQSNQPLDTNPKTGSVATLSNSIDAYAKQTSIGKSPEEQAWIKESTAHAKSLYIPKLSMQVAQQQQAYAKAASLENYQTSKNTYLSSLQSYQLMPMGKEGPDASAADTKQLDANKQAQQAVASQQHLTEMSLQHMVANRQITPEQYVVQRGQLKYDGSNATQQGRFNSYVDNFNNIYKQNPGSYQHEAIQAIQDYPEKYLNSPVDNDLGPGEKQKIYNNLKGQASAFDKQQKSANANLLLQAGQAGSLGFQNKSDELTNIGQALNDLDPSKLPEFMVQAQGGMIARSLVNSASSSPQSLILLKQNLTNDPNYGQDEKSTIDPATLEASHKIALNQINNILTEAHNDPAGFYIKDKAYVDNLQSIQDNLQGSTNQQREANQSIFNSAIHNPSSLMAAPLPQTVRDGLANSGQHLSTLQSQGGLVPQMTTKAGLNDMVQILNTSSLGDSVAKLSQLKNNDPQHYAIWQSNLINSGMDPKVFWFSKQGDDSHGLADEQIKTYDSFNDPTYMKHAMAQTSVGSEKSLSTILQGAIPNEMQDLRESFTTPYSDPQQTESMMSSVQGVLSRLVLQDAIDTNKSYKDAASADGKDLLNSLIKDKYQTTDFGGGHFWSKSVPLKYRVPNTVSTQSNPNGVPIHYSDVEDSMKKVKQMALEHVNEEYYTKGMDSEDSRTMMGLTRISIQKGDYVPNSSGTGLVLVDSLGHVVRGKGGKTMGFTWEQVVNAK